MAVASDLVSSTLFSPTVILSQNVFLHSIKELLIKNSFTRRLLFCKDSIKKDIAEKDLIGYKDFALLLVGEPQKVWDWFNLDIHLKDWNTICLFGGFSSISMASSPNHPTLLPTSTISLFFSMTNTYFMILPLILL